MVCSINGLLNLSGNAPDDGRMILRGDGKAALLAMQDDMFVADDIDDRHIDMYTGPPMIGELSRRAAGRSVGGGSQ